MINQPHPIRITLDCDSSVPSQCLTDANKLKQILTNLLTNGIKFTKHGFVNLSVKADKDNILFDCKDSGVGILPEKSKIIFEPFVQAYDQCDRVFTGAGLGLTISGLMAKAINGNLVLYRSKVGSGSHFRLSIPNQL